MTPEIGFLLLMTLLAGLGLWRFLSKTETPIEAANATNVDSKSAKPINFLEPSMRHKKEGSR
ncbi:hypothetical protein EHQ12_04150 [Leptospira gomenensis]|uniref:Uncharacterized protein n=2 Tax=Leptospira gomenensis TaxID=2484974 RepID=A0A5F1YDI5_9LEPT|nr:hypothetical protein [Leptospira gomenensis]TGK36193.1 hypothetical protein EHQ17_04570 [Leptospira gomenensis]TGK42957.1 hypothetical protein EHQ12_04150 [Leptospira gomenensis]TGK54968.1 hypothetical protein EHQ13_18405 [Leptospira gomenensis]